ncbi:MAG: class I SAM-dependent methyltransferase [Gemmatimonadales bacterium]
MPARRRLAWDCGTGSGQAATLLVSQFDRVIGSDASLKQLQAADPAPGLHYLVGLAESSAIASRSVDLVTVAQALHWLDRPRFFAEVKRVAAPGAALAVWGYNRLETAREITPLLREFHQVTVGPCWPPERKLVDQRYQGVEIPIEEVTAPPFAIEADLTLPALLGYLGTWSAVARYRETRGHDPVEPFGQELARVWGDPNTQRRVKWPLFVRAGTVRGEK